MLCYIILLGKVETKCILFVFSFLQLSAQAKIATESLKRHHVVEDENIEVAAKRHLKESLFVPQRYMYVISHLQLLFIDMLL